MADAQRLQAGVGHRFTFQTVPHPNVKFSGTGHCEVPAFEPAKMLRISWADRGEDNGLDSTVTWRLEPEGTGTRLFLEHDGFDPDNPCQRLSHQIMSGGWSAIGRKITEMLDAQYAA